MKTVNSQKNKKMKHNYTSELELKSLLIRIKNKRFEKGTLKSNSIINKYICWHTIINSNKQIKDVSKRNKLKHKIKSKIVEYSEQTVCDKDSYERFGEIILLMVKKILTKPQFSGYTYKDDFYSDAIYKILKYLHNFDHLKISERTGQTVNAFAYISQIIHNSIIFIINSKNKEKQKIQEYIKNEQVQHNSQTKDFSWYSDSHDGSAVHPASKAFITKMFYLTEQETINICDCINNIKNECQQIDNPPDKIIIEYPISYEPTFEEYESFKILKKENIIMKREEIDE